MQETLQRYENIPYWIECSKLVLSSLNSSKKEERKVEEKIWVRENPRPRDSLAVQAREWIAIESGVTIQSDNAGHEIESSIIPQKPAMYSFDAES